VQPGDAVQAGEVIMIIESMKMEVQVRSPASGTIQTLIGTKGQVVRAGQRLGVVAI
jgi:urea carboxylase